MCHEVLSECCRRAIRTVQVTPRLLADRAPPPRLTANAVAGSARAAGALLEAVKKEVAAVGFVYLKEIEPTLCMDLLGRTLGLEARVLRPSRKRLWRLWFGLDELLRKPSSSQNHVGASGLGSQRRTS